MIGVTILFRPLRSERGVALMMVLWIFMVLTVLVAEFSRGMRDEAIATQNMAEEVQARGVAFAAIGQGIYRTLRAREDNTDDEADVDPDQWPPDGTWHEGKYGGGTYSVRLIDEGGKVSLKRADEALLRRVLTNVGVTGDEQEEITDAILDWRDPDSLKRLHGAEAEYYLSLPEPYAPKNGPFDSVDELLLVRGITRDLFFGTGARAAGPKGGLKVDRDQSAPIALRDVFSVFNNTGNINVRNAPAAVLRAVMGGEEDVQAVLEARTTDPGSALTLVQAKVGDQTVARRLVDRRAETVAIDARAVMQGADIQARIGAVVAVNEDGEGFRILRWIDRLPAL
ncbi:MAG: general secretion pathway protein GspK [Deltaproteobacteria bacterium]|nr:general secretion pathway protein GspK [Deltaproteobacteria bacterium]